MHVGQHPFHARQRNASRRIETIRLREGFIGVCARGLHGGTARDGEIVKVSTERGRNTKRTKINQKHKGIPQEIDPYSLKLASYAFFALRADSWAWPNRTYPVGSSQPRL